MIFVNCMRENRAKRTLLGLNQPGPINRDGLMHWSFQALLITPDKSRVEFSIPAEPIGLGNELSRQCTALL